MSPGFDVVAGVAELPHGVLRLSTPSDRLDELELALAPILADAATYERALHLL